MLIVASALFIRSFSALAYRDLGFDRNRVSIAVVDLRAAPSDPIALFEGLRAGAATVPGVEGAALSMATPIGPSGVRMSANLEIDSGAGGTLQSARVLSTPVSPAWFGVYGTRLLEGRDFDRRDTRGAPDVAIVNRAFVQRYFRGADPVGRILIERMPRGERTPLTVVGVVEDAAFTSVRAPLDPILYKPLSQVLNDSLVAHFPTISISVRTRGEPTPSVEAAVAASIAKVNRNLSLSFQHLDAQLNVFYIRERLLAMIAGFFGTLGVLLAAVGLYGVMSYAVTMRRREMGIRMALGADGRAIRRMVLRRAGIMTALGIGAGGIGSFWLAQTVSALLYGVPA
ncbi:MAG: ABC transporter permease, partial [Gemmatimonadaceae bacterium]